MHKFSLPSASRLPLGWTVLYLQECACFHLIHILVQKSWPWTICQMLPDLKHFEAAWLYRYLCLPWLRLAMERFHKGCNLLLQLVPAVTELIIAELLYLQYKDRNKPMYLYINSTGTTRADGEVVGFHSLLSPGDFGSSSIGLLSEFFHDAMPSSARL